VAIIGAISLAAKRSIIIRDPAVLKRIDGWRTIVLDETGTLTYGEPILTDRFPAPGTDDALALQSAASVERYSKHPLARLAEQVGIDEVYAERTPEEKVTMTRQETSRAPTLFIGDGFNDAPALVTATVGMAVVHQSEIAAEAAGAVIMDTSLKHVDELFHLARRMRRIALQSAVGGMALSIVGMLIASAAGCRLSVAPSSRRSSIWRPC
jgi:cation transport ATPase